MKLNLMVEKSQSEADCPDPLGSGSRLMLCSLFQKLSNLVTNYLFDNAAAENI